MAQLVVSVLPYPDSLDPQLLAVPEQELARQIQQEGAPPKSDTKKLRASKLNNEIPATLKPDNDNILKVVQDALQDGVAFHDDKQVVRSDIIKCYGEDEKLIVEVDVMGEEDYERLKRVVDSGGVR